MQTPPACPPPRLAVHQRGSGELRNPDVTDADLVRQSLDGDGDAFGALVDRYGLAARRVARSVLGPGDDADDAVQDGMIAAWRALDRFDPARAFRPWLMRIVANASLDLLRRRKVRRAVAVPETVVSGGIPPDRMAEGALVRDRLKDALLELPERQRIAVVLFDAEGYSHAEIAGILGVPEGTVRSYVFHARRTLRGALSEFKEGE
jgi:RNA polymerase sigma-70 factor (ECF subfamily)